MSLDKLSGERLCFGNLPLTSCTATKLAINGAMEWFRDPNPETTGMDLGADVYISPKSGVADCTECERTCAIGLGIERPETTEQLLHGPYKPTEKLSIVYVATYTPE